MNEKTKVRIGEDKSGNCYRIHYGEFKTVRYVVKDSKETEDEILIALCEYILKLEFALESLRPLERQSYNNTIKDLKE